MSVRNTFPQQRPTLNLDFANSKTLDPRITFTRSQTGNGVTYVGEDGLIKYASADEPRFDHDPVTGECLGLLVEESRSNLFTRSDIEGTVGTQPIGMNLAGTGSGQSAVVSTDYYVGTNEQSCKHTRGTSGDNNVGYFGASVSANINYAFSAWVYIPESQASNFSGKYIRFFMENTYNSRTSADADTSIVGRWQRVFGVANVPANNAGGGTLTSQTWVCRTDAANGSFFYTDAWQLEAGSFSTSYINAEGGSSKTRNFDSVSMTGDNFSDWYNPSEGSIYCSVYNVGVTTTTSRFFYSIEDASAPSSDFMRQWIWNGNTSLLLNSFYTSNTTGQGSVISAEFNVSLEDVNKKISVGYAQSDFARSYNGSLTTDTSGNLPTGIDRLRIGTNLSGHISKLTYYPTRLSNDQLQNLTK
jgi:hypothetical protein